MRSDISTQFNIYLAYPTCRTDTDNFYRIMKNYIRIGTELKAYLIDWEKMDGLPKCNLYIPAEHEQFVHCAYSKKLLTDAEIIEVNCAIIENSNLLILFGGYRPMGGGIIQEVQYAKDRRIPVYTMPDLSPIAISALEFAINTIIKSGE